MDKDKLTYKAGDKVVFEAQWVSERVLEHSEVVKELFAIQKRNGGYLVVVSSESECQSEVVTLDLGCGFIKKFSISKVFADDLKLFTDKDTYCHPDLAVLRALW